MKRQQAFLSSMIKKVQDQGFSLPTLLPLADAATKSLTVDEGLGTAMKLVDFARSVEDIKLSDVTFVTAPWRFAGERVRLVQPDADTLWKLLREDRTLDGQVTAGTGAAASPTPTASPTAAAPLTPEQAAAPITVVNGVGTAGLAGSGAQTLKGRGFQNVVLGANNPGKQQTEIGYDPAQKAVADQVAALFPGARTVEEPGADSVTVTLGADYQPAGATQPNSASSPSVAPTTAPTGTTPSGIPTGIAENTRGADTDPCADLTFGS
jgi:hypothetical protein